MWTYKKPEHAGRYFVNLGDVVTSFSLEDIIFTESEHGLLDGDGVPVEEYSYGYKYMRWEPHLTPDQLNLIGNDDE